MKAELITMIFLLNGMNSAQAEGNKPARSKEKPRKASPMKYKACVEYNTVTKKITGCDEGFKGDQCDPDHVQIISEVPLAPCLSEI